MEVYRRMILAPQLNYEPDNKSDDEYAQRMEKILSAYPTIGVPRDPTMIMNNVYIGTNANAENSKLLKSLGIRYLLNMDGGSYVRFKRYRDLYEPDTQVVGYDEIPAEDREDFNIRAFFEKAISYIDYCRGRGGKVLIFDPGVSRAGAVAIAYLIANGQTLLDATRTLKQQRRVALCNVGFMRQLVSFAREKCMLDNDISTGKVPRFDSAYNRYRIRATAYKPQLF